MSGLSAEEFAEELIRQGVWKAVVDREGQRRTYYFNSTTKERVWDLVSLVVKSKLHEKPQLERPVLGTSSARRDESNTNNSSSAVGVPSQTAPSASIDVKRESPQKKVSDDLVKPSVAAVGDSKQIPAMTPSIKIDKSPKNGTVGVSLSTTPETPRLMELWQRREAVRRLAEIWRPSHHQDSTTLLLWMSLFRCDDSHSSILSQNRPSSTDTSILSSSAAVSIVVIASIPPPAGGSLLVHSGCFHAVFSSSENSSGSPRKLTTSTELFSVRFFPVDAQLSAAPITVLFDYVVLVEETPGDADNNNKIGALKSVCWALVRRKSATSVAPPLADLECAAVFTMVTISALGAPWRICSWGTAGSSKLAEISNLKISPRSPAVERLVPSLAKNTASWSSVLKQSSCSPKCVGVIFHCVEELRHKQFALLLGAKRERSSDPLHAPSPSQHQLERRHRQSDAKHSQSHVSHHSHLSLLLQEALSPSRPSLKPRVQQSNLEPQRISAATPVQKREPPTASLTSRRRSRTSVANLARTATVLFPVSPKVTPHGGLFDAIMHQLDSVADIIGC
jgi:hypothetical protein